MSSNLMISFFALTVIMASVNRIKAAPSERVMSPTQREYYLTRAWGESSIPFTVIYSNYARTKHEQQQLASTTTTTTTTTIPPTRQYRKKNVIKKSSHVPTLFVSNSWGPPG